MMGRSLMKPQGRWWWEMLFEWPWNLSMIKNVQNGALKGGADETTRKKKMVYAFWKTLESFSFLSKQETWLARRLICLLNNWFIVIGLFGWLFLFVWFVCCFFMELVDCFFVFYCLISLLVGQPHLWEPPTEIFLYNQIVFLLDDELFYNQTFNWFVFIFLIVPIV